jgi:hypothetical protein
METAEIGAIVATSAGAVDCNKYRKRRVVKQPSQQQHQQSGTTNADGMPTDLVSHGASTLRGSNVPNNNNARYGDSAGQLYVTTAAYLVAHHQTNEAIRKKQLYKFVQRYSHLLPIEDSQASTEAKVVSLLWLLEYTDQPELYAKQ